MVTFLVISRRSPAGCPTHNEASRKWMTEWAATHESSSYHLCTSTTEQHALYSSVVFCTYV